MALSKAEINKRLEYISSMNQHGVLVPKTFVEDYVEFEFFEYAVKKYVLDKHAVTTSHLPAPADSNPAFHKRLDALFNTYFSESQISAEKLFEDCRDVRAKVAKLTELTEGQLLMIIDDMGLPFTVRKYATAMLNGDIDDLHNILNQSLGKPLERKAVVSQTMSALSGLTTEELKKYLGEGEEVYEIEMEVDDEL
jgi:hypothetical protein